MKISIFSLGCLLCYLHLSCNSSQNKEKEIETLFKEKKYIDVIEQCDEVLSKINSKEALYYRAKSNYNLDRYEVAYKDYRTLYEMGDTSYKITEGLAYSSLNIQKYDYSMKLFEKMIKMDSTKDLNYFYMALLLKNDNKIDSAIIYIDLALKIRPYSKRYLNNKGSLLRQKGRYREAIICYNRILKNGYNVDTFYFNRAVNYLELKEYDSAIYDLSKAISIKEQAIYYHERAYAFMCKKDKNRACSDIDKTKFLGFLGINQKILDYCR